MGAAIDSTRREDVVNRGSVRLSVTLRTKRLV